MNIKTVASFFLITTLILINTKDVFAAGQLSATVADGAADSKIVNARVVIDASPAAVWQILTNYNDLKNYVPGYQESKVIQSNGASKTVHLGVKVSKFLPTMKYQVKINENRAANQISINRISGDFQDIKATYKLIPSEGGNKTVLVYHLDITLGDKIPKIGVNKSLKASAEDILGAIQNQSASLERKSVIAKK